MTAAPPALAVPQASLRHYRGEYGAHAHAHAQVLCAQAGRLELEVGGRGYAVEAGRGLVVPPGTAHAYLAERPAAMWVIDAPAGPGLERVRHFAFVAPASEADALHWLANVAAAPRALRRRRLDLGALDAAIDGALHERWTAARMAALLHFSVPRLHARLLELTGLSPQAYLRRRRLDRAARLIAAGRSLEMAALEVGYATASALAFALRRERGVGARALRAG